MKTYHVPVRSRGTITLPADLRRRHRAVLAELAAEADTWVDEDDAE